MNNKEISKVYLLDVPLENDYKNTLYFASASAQQTYFQSRIKKSALNVSYIRKDGYIRYPDYFDNLQDVNYIMYQNSYYSNKWFYGFITRMEYVDDGRTDIYFETDVLQTWNFDYQVKASFVEREHTNNDTIGVNTYPEELETGEYVCENKSSTNFGLAHSVIAVTEYCKTNGPTDNFDMTNKDKIKSGGSLINGVYHGCSYILCKDKDSISNILASYSSAGKVDAITGIFMVPDTITGYNEFSTQPSDEKPWYYAQTLGGLSYGAYAILDTYLNITTADDMGNFTTSKPLSTVNGYTPRNNKLFCYPYKYMLVSNNNGGNGIYRYEFFSSNNVEFNTKGALTPGSSIRTAPLNYKGVDRNNEEGLNLGKYPICSWSSDMYTNWLTQNSVNIGVSIATDVLKIGGGIAGTVVTGGALGIAGGGTAIYSGLSGIATTVGEIYQHSLVPNQAEGNQNCGDVTYSNGDCNFTFYKMNIREEYARIIDGFFDMFGYKVATLKVPNKNHRARWWYTKTIDVNIDGAVPNQDMQKIKDCYDKGITFWRNASEIQNYSLSNNII